MIVYINIITDRDLLVELTSKMVNIIGTESPFDLGFIAGQMKWQRKFMRYNNSFTQEETKTTNKKITRIINMERIFPIEEVLKEVIEEESKKINKSLETKL